jgi:hypothetical protein
LKRLWVVGVILFSPISLGLILVLAILLVGKLPIICCERLRAVRYLPLAGLCYYGLLVTMS